MANIEEIKKYAAEEGIDLSEDVLEAIAGGKYSDEEWSKMTEDERIAAQDRSVIAKFVLHIECEMD